MTERELALELENKRLREALSLYADENEFADDAPGTWEAKKALAQPAPETSRILRLAKAQVAVLREGLMFSERWGSQLIMNHVRPIIDNTQATADAFRKSERVRVIDECLAKAQAVRDDWYDPADGPMSCSGYEISGEIIEALEAMKGGA